jgi:hypothetical protein
MAAFTSTAPFINPGIIQPGHLVNQFAVGERAFNTMIKRSKIKKHTLSISLKKLPEFD